MKKLVLVLAAAALTLTSCSTSKQTAHTQQICTSIKSGATATLEVSPQKITYSYIPNKAVRKGGYQNCINAAVREALMQNGNADVLVEMQNIVVERQGLMGSKIKTVTVSGFPATYKEIKSMDHGTLQTLSMCDLNQESQSSSPKTGLKAKFSSVWKRVLGK